MGENETYARTDHRRLRTVRTRANILGACRRMMAEGNIRPGVGDVALAAHCSLRTIFERFGTLDMLYAEAVDDTTTSGAVLSHVLGEDWRTAGIPGRWVNRIARATVLKGTIDLTRSKCRA